MVPDIFTRREKNFVLWRVNKPSPAPKLIIGRLELGAPLSLKEQQFELRQSADFPEIWEISAAGCNLSEGQVYHYWFEVTVDDPEFEGKRIRVTDPLAYSVDWRLISYMSNDPVYKKYEGYPASIITYSQGNLIPCDAGGETGRLHNETPLSRLSPNNRTVIYELPTAWSSNTSDGLHEIGVGTFRDVLALVEEKEEGGNFSGFDVTRTGRSYLSELGINALELLPPADSFYKREWGYGTTNFFAPDYDLGFPANYSWPVPNRDLSILIDSIHQHGIRFFIDVVMAFSKNNPYLSTAADDFFILNPRGNSSDPDAHNSRGKDDGNFRDGFGSSLFRYAKAINGYDPLSGQKADIFPARQYMKAYLLRWMNDFHIDGIRMDSVENVYNWDFIGEFKNLARDTWRQRFISEQGNAEERFIVVGEELQEPLDILRQNRLDGLWHESFKKYIRAALLGQNAEGEPSFEWTVRKAIDCRNFGYKDGANAVIYLTSHDVEGYRNERLFNFLQSNGVADAEKRIKLAFVCLLTAVGIPQILAGDEFADQHDLFDRNGNVHQNGGKQVDPVNFSRLNDEWRIRVKNYSSNLIKFRTTSDALAVNDTEFIHVDFNEGKRVLVWKRGIPNSDKIVVVVANFSDFGTPDPFNPSSEYRVPNWPATPAGKSWKEISQQRPVSQEQIGREAIFPWEAKVYALV